jgi:hypothetical protein
MIMQNHVSQKGQNTVTTVRSLDISNETVQIYNVGNVMNLAISKQIVVINS